MDGLFYFASKLLWLVTAPDVVWLVLLILGFALSFTRRRRAGHWLTGALLAAGVVILAVRPAQDVAQPLENRFPRPAWPACVHGILMLGGGESPLISAGRGTAEITEGAPRLLAAIELLRRYPTAQLIFSGGSGNAFEAEPPEASTVQVALAQLGIDPARVRYEDQSRNTWEGEVDSMALAEPKPDQRWVLVTSAMHMPRAIGIARRLGWTMLPWPAGYTSLPAARSVSDGHFAKNFADLTTAVHEWIGLVAYRLSGRTSTLFPAPEPEPETISCPDTPARPTAPVQ